MDKEDVTQADRDAAADYSRRFPEIRLNDALAAHRIKSTARLQAQLDMAVNTVADYEAEIIRLRADREAVIRECAAVVFPVVMEHMVLSSLPDANIHNKAVQKTGSAAKAAILALIEQAND